MIAKFTFNYNGGFEKKENAVFQQGSIGVDSYQVFAPFLTTTQVYVKTKRNGDLDFSLWKQLDYNSTIGGWLKTATQDELLVDGELKVVFKFNNLVSQETSLWVRKGTLIVPEMTTYEALRDYAESLDGRIDQLIAGETAVHHVQFNNTLVDGDVTDKPSIMYDSYEQMFRAINDDDTDIVIGGELQKLVRNENSEDLAEGRIVAISGAVGQRVTIDTFDISSESEHSRIPAVITKSGVIALHGLGKVSFFGEIKGLPIANFESTGTAYAEGQPLYCSINSKITNVVPAKPNLHVHIGTLERIVGATANVFIHTLVIPHFSHLSDVVTTNPLNGQVWYYESATKTFKNTNYFRVIGDKVAINQPNEPRKNLDLGGSFILTGSIQFADTMTESDGRVKLYQSNGFVNVRNFNDDYTILKIWSKPGAVGNDREATIALVRGDNDEEFIDLYNNGYTSETQHGIRIQKRGTGQYRDFVFDHYDGTTKTPVFILKADGKVGVGTNTPTYKFDVVGDGRFTGVVIATNITDITNRVETLETKVQALEESTTSIYDYKGSLLFENLPTTGQVTGDTYNILNDFTLGGESYLAGTDVAWNGSAWNPLGSHIPNGDEVQYSLGVSVNEKIDSKVDKTSIVDNLTTDDATKVLSAKQGKALQDTKEALANKAIDFSVVNDTKFPTTKAVSERLLNLPIAELNNHTLREVFEGGNILLNPIFNITGSWSSIASTSSISGGILFNTGNGTSTSSYIQQTISLTGTNNIYLRTRLRVTNSLATSIRLRDASDIAIIILNNPQINTWYDLSVQDNINDYRIRVQHNYIDSATNNLKVMEVDYVYAINKTSLGISTLTVTQMDYWFSVYQALLVSDTNAIFSMFASKTLEAWITPTLTTATTTYLKYRKDNFGSVIIEGNITVTTAGTNFTLPTGYRPLFAYTVGILTFNTNGTVVSSATGTQTLSVRFTGGA